MPKNINVLKTADFLSVPPNSHHIPVLSEQNDTTVCDAIKHN